MKTPTKHPAAAWQPPIDPHGQLQAAATSLGLSLSVTQGQRLLDYLALLLRWNKVYNLTALRSPAEALTHHLIDCLAVLPPLERWLTAQQAHGPTGARADQMRLLDVGSGGGLPGVVLAILHPEWRVDCVDAVAKKASFIRQAALELQLPQLRGVHARVEELSPAAAGYQVITCRAFASLADFTHLSRPLLADGGSWLAMKAQLTPAEQAQLPDSVHVFHVEQLQVPGLNAARCLVWMRPTATPA